MITLHSNPIIDQLIQQNPDHVVLAAAKEQLTAGQLLSESMQLAVALREQGMKENDRVVIAVEPGAEFVKIVFAIMMLRVQVAIIDPEMGRENYRAKLDQFKPQWAFLDSRIMLLQEHPILRWMYFFFKKNGLYFPMNRKIKTILTGPRLPIFQKHKRLSQLFKQSPECSLELKPNQQPLDFVITYTSGTTKAPKGVMHTLSSLGNSIALIVELIKTQGAQTMATHLPHFMMIGACAGIKVHIWKESFSAKEKIDFIVQHGITTLFAPPAEYLELIRYCKKQGQLLPVSLTHLLIGSAPVHTPFLARLVAVLDPKVKITCLYGMTENLVVATIDGREKLAYACDGDALGTPAEGVALKIADDGEILLHSNQLFKKYLHLPNHTGWHATGDLGKIDDNGKLILMGRKKEMIIRRNFNLYPALYESTIKKIPGIEEAVLVGIYNEVAADEEVILAIESDEKISVKQIRKKLERGAYSIDREAWPDQILFRPIPRKGRQQKIDRQLLVQEISSV